MLHSVWCLLIAMKLNKPPKHWTKHTWSFCEWVFILGGPFLQEHLTLANIQIWADTLLAACTTAQAVWGANKAQATVSVNVHGTFLTTHLKTELQKIKTWHHPRQKLLDCFVSPFLFPSFFSFCHALHMVDRQASMVSLNCTPNRQSSQVVITVGRLQNFFFFLLFVFQQTLTLQPSWARTHCMIYSRFRFMTIFLP